MRRPDTASAVVTTPRAATAMRWEPLPRPSRFSRKSASTGMPAPMRSTTPDALPKRCVLTPMSFIWTRGTLKRGSIWPKRGWSPDSLARRWKPMARCSASSPRPAKSTFAVHRCSRLLVSGNRLNAHWIAPANWNRFAPKSSAAPTARCGVLPAPVAIREAGSSIEYGDERGGKGTIVRCLPIRGSRSPLTFPGHP